MRYGWLAILLSLFVLLSPVSATAHEAGYYPDENLWCTWDASWGNYGWTDCLIVGPYTIPARDSAGYDYDWIAGDVLHLWWGIPQYTEQVTYGYCYPGDYCVRY